MDSKSLFRDGGVHRSGRPVTEGLSMSSPFSLVGTVIIVNCTCMWRKTEMVAKL